MDIKELEKKFQELSDNQAKMEKDFTLKLDSAQKDTKQYKELAEKREEELRQFKESAEKSERERKQSMIEANKTGIKEFVEAQIKSGRVIPAHKERLISFMETLSSEEQVVKFKEKDGSTSSHTQLSLFKDLISKMKPVVPIGSEFTVDENMESESPSDEIEGGEMKAEKFMAVRSEGVVHNYPVKDSDIAEKALQYQEDQKKIGRVVSYEEALIAVSPKRKIKS